MSCVIMFDSENRCVLVTWAKMWSIIKMYLLAEANQRF